MKILKAATVFALLAMTTMLGPANAKGAECDNQEVGPILEPISGSARLCVSHHGLRGHMWVKDLVPGDAYTVWWTYFDDPSKCATPGACGAPSDFAGPNPLSVFGRMDSVVANSRGRAQFSDQVRGMHPTSGSQIWFLIFGHGNADGKDGRHLARQLLTPEDPFIGAPHLGNTVDGPLGLPAAVAVFMVD